MGVSPKSKSTFSKNEKEKWIKKGKKNCQQVSDSLYLYRWLVGPNNPMWFVVLKSLA